MPVRRAPGAGHRRPAAGRARERHGERAAGGDRGGHSQQRATRREVLGERGDGVRADIGIVAGVRRRGPHDELHRHPHRTASLHTPGRAHDPHRERRCAVAVGRIPRPRRGARRAHDVDLTGDLAHGVRDHERPVAGRHHRQAAAARERQHQRVVVGPRFDGGQPRPVGQPIEAHACALLGPRPRLLRADVRGHGSSSSAMSRGSAGAMAPGTASPSAM